MTINNIEKFSVDFNLPAIPLTTPSLSLPTGSENDKIALITEHNRTLRETIDLIRALISLGILSPDDNEYDYDIASMQRTLRLFKLDNMDKPDHEIKGHLTNERSLQSKVAQLL